MLAEGYTFGEQKSSHSKKSYSMYDGLKVGFDIKLGEVGKRSQESYRNTFYRLTEWLNESGNMTRSITYLDKSYIISFMDWLVSTRSLSNHSYNNYLNFLKAAMTPLVERGILESNPAKGVRGRKTKSTTHYPYLDEQREFMEEYLRENDPQLYIYTRFVYYAFLRPVECLRIRIGDIRLNERRILIKSHDTKSGVSRTVSMPKPLVEVVQDLDLGSHPPDWLVFSIGLRPGLIPVSREMITKRHTKALKKAGLYNGKLTMYSWRHTGACNAYRAGVGIIALKNQIGHSTLDMTYTYLRDLGMLVDDEILGAEW